MPPLNDKTREPIIQAALDALVLGWPDVTTGKMFGSRAYRAGGVLFAIGRLRVAQGVLPQQLVLALGPRRTGKTSILLAIRDQPPAGNVALFLNLEKHSTVGEWLQDMLTATRAAVPTSSAKSRAGRVRAIAMACSNTVRLPTGTVTAT